jgi:O-antigen/teichoic acid export membrane protein
LLVYKKIIAGAFLTTAAQFSKIAAGFVLLKAMALYLTVDEFGVLGNYMSLAMILSLLSGGGIQNGIVKYIAQYKNKPKILIEFMLVAKTYMLFVCIFLSVLVIFSLSIAEFIFKDANRFWAVALMFIAQFILSFVAYSYGVINGYQKTKIYAEIQIIGSVISSIASWFLLEYLSFDGGIIAILLFYCSYSIPLIYIYRKSKFRKHIQGLAWNWKIFKDLMNYSIMALTGVVSIPFVEILIRNELLNYGETHGVGIWQASLKISSAYMGFLIVFLSVYYYPIIAKTSDKKEIISLVGRYIFGVMLIFIASVIPIYLWRGDFIELILSSNFYDLNDIIIYQLISDFFRISGYVIGFLILAKSATHLYIIGELSQGIIFYILSSFLIKNGAGVKGVFISYLSMNVMYFVIMVIGFLIYSKRKIHAVR